MDKSDLLPIPEGERVPVLVPIPKIWMDMFDTIAAKMQLDRPTYILQLITRQALQLITRQAQTIATRVGGETAPLSNEETEGEFRTIAIAITKRRYGTDRYGRCTPWRGSVDLDRRGPSARNSRLTRISSKKPGPRMKRNTKKPALRLRSVTGMLDDVVLAVPVDWVATLRVQADKLDLSVEEMIVQYIGHISAEREALGEAVASPTLGDAMARFRLSGSLLKSFQGEADRLGIPVVTVMHHAVSAAADVFEGRPKAPMAKPISLVPRRSKATGQ